MFTFSIFRLIFLNRLLEEGNALFRSNEYCQASQIYILALTHLSKSISFKDHSETTRNLKNSLILNLSRSERRQGNFIEAAKVVTEIIEEENNNIEALVTRAKAEMEMGFYEIFILLND